MFFASYAYLATVPVQGLAAFCFWHVLIAHVRRSRGPYFGLMIGGGIGFLMTMGWSIAALVMRHTGLADSLALLSMNLAEYLALAFGYFNFVNLNIASLRIRMMQDLADAGGSMAVEKVLAGYNTEDVSNVRIGRLVRGGHLIEREGRYYSGKRSFLLVGRIFDFLRRAIIGQSRLSLRESSATFAERKATIN